MKIIKLLGDLQAFREEWELDVRTPGEALRAIEANRPGFLSACDAGDYAVILVDQINPDFSRQITLVEAELPWADELLVVVPKAGGDIPAAFLVPLFTSIGFTASAATIAAGVAVAVINIGISLAVSAIANAITSDKKKVSARDQEAPESKPSFISNGPVNVVRQGHPYPIIAGEFLCGSIVVSSQIHVKDIPI